MPSSERLSDAGLMGLCAVARALALRLAATGLRVSLWDSSAPAIEEFVAGNYRTLGGLVGFANRDDFFESLNSPWRIVAFDTESGNVARPLRVSDRLLEYPFADVLSTPADLDQLEWTLLFQLT